MAYESQRFKITLLTVSLVILVVAFVAALPIWFFYTLGHDMNSNPPPVSQHILGADHAELDAAFDEGRIVDRDFLRSMGGAFLHTRIEWHDTGQISMQSRRTLIADELEAQGWAKSGSIEPIGMFSVCNTSLEDESFELRFEGAQMGEVLSYRVRIHETENGICLMSRSSW